MGHNSHHLKNLHITNTEESVEKRVSSYTACGNINRCSHCGKQYEYSLKKKKKLKIRVAI